jgi:hypothetical protein
MKSVFVIAVLIILVAGIGFPLRFYTYKGIAKSEDAAVAFSSDSVFSEVPNSGSAASSSHASDVPPPLSERGSIYLSRVSQLSVPHPNDWAALGREGGKDGIAKPARQRELGSHFLDAHAWLADVLARLPDHPAKRIHELLPWNWKTPTHAAAA